MIEESKPKKLKRYLTAIYDYVMSIFLALVVGVIMLASITLGIIEVVALIQNSGSMKETAINSALLVIIASVGILLIIELISFVKSVLPRWKD